MQLNIFANTGFRQKCESYLDLNSKKYLNKQEYNDDNLQFAVISNGPAHVKKGVDFSMTTSYQGYGFILQLRQHFQKEMLSPAMLESSYIGSFIEIRVTPSESLKPPTFFLGMKMVEKEPLLVSQPTLR